MTSKPTDLRIEERQQHNEWNMISNANYKYVHVVYTLKETIISQKSGQN